MFIILGHLGLWAGFYALAALICFNQLSRTNDGFPLPRWEAMVCVLLTATAVYSLDRVKLFTDWLDPADIAAQPDRYSFLLRRTPAVRLLALSLLLAAAGFGFLFHPFTPFIVLFAALSTVFYAPKARGAIARVKDRLWLKNAYVAVGMTGFAALMSLLSGLGHMSDIFQRVLNLELDFAIAFVAVCLRVFFDAALCDIDDEPTDLAYRTETFATSFGSRRVWHWAGLGRLLLAIGLLVALPLPLAARALWSAAMLLGMIALRWRHPVRIRDTVDIRFLPEAAFVTIVLWLFFASNS
jgi:4-hydroxybenzoate polyprenyltransferase